MYNMAKIQGFVLKHHRVTTNLRYMFCRRTSTTRYQKQHTLQIPSRKPLTRFLKWTKRLKTKAKAICSKTPGSGSSRGYVQMGHEPHEKKSMLVPKGHMAVYVGQKDGDNIKRVMVPVIYFNHPLFSELLREVESEYGFNHHGGINIPCRISEFERVQTRIKMLKCQ